MARGNRSGDPARRLGGPGRRGITLGEYAKRWVAERDLKARTREEYERLLRLHVLPYLADVTLAATTSAKIRTWRTDRLVGGVGRSTVAKTYRILHAVFATAVDDDLVRRNPCRIKGAGSDHTDERPTAS
jgi:site-specific recombinase XerD